VGGNTVYILAKTSVETIEQTLQLYNVDKIVTGHTIWEGVAEQNIGKWVSVHLDGRVINLDTDHKRGYTEGVYVENGEYFTVNQQGMRSPILRNLQAPN
jgi:hypothetical protein